MKQIEAEGGELLIQNSLGSYAIIPKKDVETLRNHILEGCHDCIDKYVTSLPRYETANGKAEDGVLLMDDPKDPNPKIKEARDWLNNWYWDRKMSDKNTQDLLTNSSDGMNEFIADVPTYARLVFTDTNATVMDSDLLVNEGESKAESVLGAFNGESVEYADGVQSSNVPLHELTHAGDSKMEDGLRTAQADVVSENTKEINYISELGAKMYHSNAKDALKLYREKLFSTLNNERFIAQQDLRMDGYSSNDTKKELFNMESELIERAAKLTRRKNPVEYEKMKRLIPKNEDWNDFSAKLLANKPYSIDSATDYYWAIKEGSADYYNNYIKDFDEVHARIMEIRKDLDIKPDQVIDQKFIDDNRDKLKKNDAYLDIMEVTKEGDASLINLLNKLVDVEKNDSGIKNT